MESLYGSVQDVCSALNDQATKLSSGASLLREQKRIALMQLKVQSSAAGIIPSGPRKRGEGCDDENQGILAAEETPSGGARLRVTLLAAGFVIGPGGSSIRAISHKSGADIRSWNDSLTTNGRARRVRTIVIEGNHRSTVLALSILCEAIELYKELCEGKYCGKFVDRCQYIRGVEFVYSPPPRSAVPYAAALKPDSGSTSPASEGGNNLSMKGSSPSGGYNSQNTSHSPTPMYLNSLLQEQETQTIRALHVLGSIKNGSAVTAAATAISQQQQGSGLLFDPGMASELESAAALGMSSNDPLPMVTDADVASLQAELNSCATTTATSALAAALAGPSAFSLLSQSGNTMTTMAPETPSAFQKMYDTSNTIPAATGDTIMANMSYTTTTATARNSNHPSTSKFMNMFRDNSMAVDGNATLGSTTQPVLPSPEPAKEIPCYSLFGPDGNVFGPNLLRDIWGPDGNGPGLPPIPSWRGMTAVAVNDDQLNMIGLPSYEDFAEKSPYYNSNSNSLRNVLKSSEVPSLRINNNGFLFSAYEDNSASNSNTTLNRSKPDPIAAANQRYVYHTTNEHDQHMMHDV